MKKSIYYILHQLIKLIFYFALFSILVISNAIVWKIEPFLKYLYMFVSCVCFAAFGLTFFTGYRKIAYIIFGAALLVFILMGKYVPEIKEQHDIDTCLDGGMIYDPIQKICRNDCLTWDKELGCIREENLSTDEK